MLRMCSRSWGSHVRGRKTGVHTLSTSTEFSTTLSDGSKVLWRELGYMFDLIQFGAFVAFVNNYVLSITQCVGPSMIPTIGTSGDIVLTIPTNLRDFFTLRKPCLNDIVICTSPNDQTQTVCKRILGMPGDTVTAFPPPGWSGSQLRQPV
eukprot:CAMPEP_0119342758 /NCGR_PEP_ID=MMETSP1333-20130426/105381_1 /TAXON_ID=418940 /ORGANISM="Scyphosphaera apsteinii, Strain RCC1455" /LENGTH=149 /DNA_ID=CAMNT_0007355041 /DNA_START=14 /DNA_END=459 /DNA_ORIENTATION=-